MQFGMSKAKRGKHVENRRREEGCNIIKCNCDWDGRGTGVRGFSACLLT